MTESTTTVGDLFQFLSLLVDETKLAERILAKIEPFIAHYETRTELDKVSQQNYELMLRARQRALAVKAEDEALSATSCNTSPNKSMPTGLVDLLTQTGVDKLGLHPEVATLLAESVTPSDMVKAAARTD